MANDLDLSRAPRGVLAANELIAAVAAVGDLAERHYLELKSTLDLSTKKHKEKIAKFILGAANRMPDVASTAFEGYGVMIIGVSQGAIIGIPPVEMMEISKVVQQYVGAAGPRWDILWVPIEGSSNQVLVVLVDPPKFGHGPFPCRASGESLTDGRIYIRADGETREAGSAELDLLLQRGRAGVPVDVDFLVEVKGEVTSVILNEATTVDDYLTAVRRRLVAALPSSEPIVLGTRFAGLTGYVSTASTIAGFMSEPETRTEEEYLDSIDRWTERFRSAWQGAKLKITGSQLEPAIIIITNRTSTFFHDVQVKLHLEGDVSAFDYTPPQRADDFSDLELPHPPRKWGPTQRAMGIPNYGLLPTYAMNQAPYISSSVSFRNGGSVDLELDVGELRPRGFYESEDEEFVLVVVNQSLTAIRGTWELTARDHNEVYAGEITIAVTGPNDLTSVARQILGLDADRPD